MRLGVVVILVIATAVVTQLVLAQEPMPTDEEPMMEEAIMGCPQAMEEMDRRSDTAMDMMESDMMESDMMELSMMADCPKPEAMEGMDDMMDETMNRTTRN